MIIEGDANTTYFHKMTSWRRRTNTILAMDTKDGDVREEKRIHEYFYRNYKNLFRQEHQRQLEMSESFWDTTPNLSTLEEPFSEREIMKVIRELEHDKAPAPDTFPIFFL